MFSNNNSLWYFFFCQVDIFELFDSWYEKSLLIPHFLKTAIGSIWEDVSWIEMKILVIGAFEVFIAWLVQDVIDAVLKGVAVAYYC